MNKLTTAMMTATFALGLSATALANDDWMQEPSYHGEQDVGAEVSFDELDVNGDGYVYQADVPAEHELATLFAQYDLDRDGRLSRAEFALYAGDDEETEPAE
jgi:Ca2+-binding EF-hand superfamily protein